MFVKTEEQELLLESLRQLFKRDFPESYLAGIDNTPGGYAYDLAKALLDNGYTLLGVPEEFGGTPASVTTLCLVNEELGRQCAPYSSLNSSLTIGDMLAFGTEAQKKLVIDAVKETGIPPCALGIPEPQAGSDDSAIASTYTRRNGKVYINGHKTFMSGAGKSPYGLVFAKNPNAPDPRKAISCWLVKMDLPGITMSELHKIGNHATPTYEVYFDEVEVEEDALVGKEGEGFFIIMKNFEPERLLISAGSLGNAEAVFEDAARYANQRIQFGKPIGSFQLIQEKITDMYLKIENMRNMIYSAAADIDEGKSARISSAMCKYYCARALFEVADDAMQVLGGIGYTNDHRVSRVWRDARANRIGGGTDEIMIHILGRQLLKQFG